MGRDILVRQIPIVLQFEFYAVAAAAGAAVCVLFLRRDRRRNWPMLVGAIVCFTVRMVTWVQNWTLPQVIG